MIIQGNSERYSKGTSYLCSVLSSATGGSATTLPTELPEVPNIPRTKENEQLKRILDSYFINLTAYLKNHAENRQLHKDF